jgi:hypothetical protein
MFYCKGVFTPATGNRPRDAGPTRSGSAGRSERTTVFEPMTDGAIMTAKLTRRTYRQLVYGIVTVAILGLAAGTVLGQELAGTTIYMAGVWVGGAVAFLAPRLTDRTLQDERDSELHNRASGLLMGIAMTVSLGVIPAVYVLDAGGGYELSGAVWGSVATLSALFLLYGLCIGIVKRR